MRDSFEICVRGIIFKDNKILVCQQKGKDYYFFPGGHVEFGENSQDALIRELKEELNLSLKKVEYIGTVENIYKDKEKKEKHHEINLVFEVKADKVKDKSKEDHLDFFFFDKEKFQKEKVLPLALRNVLIKWLKDKKKFWLTTKR